MLKSAKFHEIHEILVEIALLAPRIKLEPNGGEALPTRDHRYGQYDPLRS